ncbi:MAG: tandem-95 repeat protein [Planctomycetota bacterium]
MTDEAISDRGRSTGAADQFVGRLANQGPLIQENQINAHAINGLEIRGEIVTRDTVWDDTGITHVVEQPIYSLTGSFGGALRLRSAVNQSLVVKFGENGTLIGGGRPLDIEDRIGGTLQILGSDAFPVVLTSLLDDSIGAGFTPDGDPLNQTLGNPPTDDDGNVIPAAAGDWVGLQLQSYINDRNVAYVYESEIAEAAAINSNASPDDAQTLGGLAVDQKGGDENRRLGIQLRGVLATPADVDTYAFTASGRTRVVIDIDETESSLDTVIEVVTGDGEVIARSDNSLDESVGIASIFVDESLPEGVVQDDVRPLETSTLAGNVESPNRRDAGLAIVLPGDASEQNEYFVRVRTAAGLSSGQYTMSLRLGDDSETAGSTVRRADIRFATRAIQVDAAPLHSPLVGDAAEEVSYIDPTPGDRNSGDEQTRETANARLSANPAQAQDLGNLLTSDRGSLVVTGELGNISNLSVPALYNSLLDERLEDVDVYRVDLFTQQIEPDVFDNENRFVTTTFDIDYADQLGRPNTVLSVFDGQGRLILVGRDSNIADDVSTDPTDLDAGSAGTLDAYIGPVELPEGTYFVAVSNEAVVPRVLNQFFEENPTEGNTRLMPLNSVRRIGRDSFEEDDFNLIGFPRVIDYTAEEPTIEPLFSEASAVPYTLDDIRLFVSYDTGISGSNQTSIASFNPFTGTMERLIGQSAQPTGDLAIRRDGELYTYSVGPEVGVEFNNASVGNYINISAIDGGARELGDDGIVFRQSNEGGDNTENQDAAQLIIEAIAYPRANGTSSINRTAINQGERFWVVGTRDAAGRGGEVPQIASRNILYSAQTTTGVITSLGSTNANADRDFDGQFPYSAAQYSSGSNEIEFGIIDTGFGVPGAEGDGGTITGLAIDPTAFGFGDTLVGVTDLGGIHVFNSQDNVTVPTPDGLDFNASVIPTTYHGRLPAAPDHFTASFDPLDPSIRFPVFSGLSFGPQFIEGQAYQQTLFATTPDGWLYAFDLSTDLDGNPSVEPAHVFYDGRYAVQLTFLFGGEVGQSPHGLAFSNLEVNPWHLTNDRFDDIGHGQVTNYDLSREPLAIGGGNSLYFGFEITADPADNTVARPENDALGDISPGGAHGSVISDSFDLSEYSEDDKPTLYFSYNLEVEANDDFLPGVRLQRDSFRVFGAGDDGQWRLLATNNDFRELPLADEYDYFFQEGGSPVQEIFDDAGADQWRQVRADLSPLAGSRDVRIRFDFSTAGSMRSHFGSVELIGIDGEVVPDNDLVTLSDQNFNGTVLQTIVGTDLVLPAGNQLADGNTFTVVGAGGDRTVVEFVSVAGTSTADVEILINPLLDRQEVALAVATALPASLRASIDSDATISLLAARSIEVGPNLLGGQASPERLVAGERTLLITPNGDLAVEGETITLSTFGPDIVLTFVRSANATGAAGEIVFDSGDTDAAIALRVADAINAGLGAGTALAVGGDVQMLTNFVTITLGAGPSALVVTPLNAGNVQTRLSLAAADQLNDDEVLLFNDGVNDFAIVLDDDFNVPAGVVPGGTVSATVAFTDATNPTTLQNDIIAAINTIAPQVTPVADGTDILIRVESFSSQQAPTLISSTQTTGLQINFPRASELINGEQIFLNTPLGVRTVTFNQSATASSLGQVNYQLGPSTPRAQLVSDFANVALDANLDIGFDGEKAILYGMTETDIILGDPNSRFTFSEIEAVEIDVPAGAGLNDRETLQVVAAAGSPEAALTNTNTLELRDTDTFAGPLDPNDFGFQRSLTDEQVRDNLLAVLSPLGVATDGTTDRLLVPGSNTVITTPASGFVTLRFESFVNVTVPDGDEIRDGEVLEVFGGGVTTTLTFLRIGTPVPPLTGPTIFFDETSTSAELSQQIVARLNAISATFNALVTNDGFGLGIDDAEVRIIVDPILSEIGLADAVDTYAIPMTLPAGNQITPGEQFTVFAKDSPRDQVGQTYTFVTVPSGASREIVFNPGSSPEQVAFAVAAALDPNLGAQLSAGGSRSLLLQGASSLRTAPGSNIVSFEAAVDTGINFGADTRAIPVIVNALEDSAEVTLALQKALADSLGYFANEDFFAFGTEPLETNATAFDYKAYVDDRIRLYATSVFDPGPFGLSELLPGDEFGLGVPISFSPNQIGTQGAQNNEIEGVYIDDIIVGFAERGEAVLYEDYLTRAGDTTFVIDPAYVPDSRPDSIQPENPDEVLVGPYTLEIRTADEYGVPQDYDPINLVLDETISSGRSIDPNDRLADGATTLLFPDGDQLIDGDRFVIDNGVRAVTFEFNSVFDDRPATEAVDPGSVLVPFSVGDSAFEVAASARDAINQFRLGLGDAPSVFDVVARTGDSRSVGVSTSARVELFGDDITINPGSGRTLKVDAVEAETPFGEFSTRRIPIVDQDLGTVNYAQYIFETGNATVPYYRPGDTLIVSGKIGDQVRKGVENEVSADDGQILFTDPTTDLDVVRVYLEAGTPIEIDVDTIELSRDSNGLELPIVTVLPSGTQLDAAGLFFENSPVAVSSLFAPTSAPGESIGGAYLTFTPTESRYYDIVVSSLGAYGGFFGLSAIDRLSGDYQMTLRPLGDPAVPTRDVIGVDYQFGQTDVNRTRDQGQLLIENNIISDSSEVGINATLGDRGQAGTTTANVLPILGPGLATGVDDFTRPGAARLLRNENPFDLIPGTVIVNNLVQRSGDAAIVFGGGTFDNGESAAPNLFGRIVNNTLIGNEDDAGVDSGTGIRVSGRSAPTLLNNVLVNLDSGINVDTTNASLTETAGNVFAEVNTPSTLPIDATSLVLTDATGLFVDSDRGIYIPQANSVLVDSSIQSLPDRSELFDTVKEPVGIAPSPLLAPGFDALGQLRVDGPGGGGGAGGDSFVDRGAFERTDNIGPEARLTVPLDAVGIISTEGDADAAPAVVRLVEDLSFPFFEVELSDDGVGIDPATVSPASVVLREDGVVLREGLDYLFGYSSAGTTIRLTSTRGEFRRDATYEIQIRNVQDRLGNDILETNAIGQTQLTIITSGVNFDYGDAPESYLTTAAQGGPSHANPGVGSPRLGDRVDTEADGAASANADSDDIPQSLSGTSSGTGLVVSADVGELEINIVSVPSIGERVSFNLAGERFTVEFTRPDVNPTIGNLVVDLDDDPTVDEVATVLRDLIDDQITQRGITAGLVDTGTPTVIRLESRDDEDGVSTGVFTTNSGESYTVFGVPAPDGSIDQSSAQGVLSPGGTTTFIVRATDVLPGQTFLDLWIDFGGDGTFGTSDKIEIEDSLVEGDNPITVTTPAGVTAKETFMRLRISTVGGLSPNGVVSGGEVEDYPISIAPDDLGLPVNNQPTFATASPLDIPEADTDDPRVFTNFLTNILPGGPDNAVENANQIVVDFTVTNLVDAGGILLNDPVVIYNDGDSEASIQIESRTDTFGQISFTVTAIDDHPTNPRTRSEDVTVNVRPVNDAPRLNPAISSQSDRSNSQDLNDSYVVDDSLPLITFTLREDNVGPNLISQPYFIPLNQPSGVGYNRIGLLDLFTAGPTNEIDASPGGSQVLSLTRLGPDPNVDINAGPVATTLGGTVDPVFENGNLIGVNYTPPADVNENFAALDSFVYEVTDDSPVGGETFDIETGTLIEDNIGTEGRVQFRLLPINDRPEFTIGQVQAIPEDASPVLLEQFAQGIAAGPAGAFDENDVTGGQNVSFSITSLTFGQQLADRFFTIYPSIDASSGNLIFQAAPDVYGTFDFEVVLTDDGPSPNSSNPNGNVNTSVPATLTLKINPTNDPPQIDPSADPISATIQEDTSTAFVIDDLLAAFRPGPAANTDFVVETDPTDESIDGKIGGGQTITLTDPLPTTSSAGGSITQETIMVGGVAVDRLVYTPPDHFVGRDTFVYTVTDDGISVVVGGDLTNPADRISDPRIAANTVSIDVTPVNDRPEFSGAQNVTVDEDSGQVSIENWATNVRSGPATAFDEIDSQTLNFDIAYQSGDASIVVGTPSVLIGDDGNADLQFETAADASGSVTYTVQLVDSGDGMNATNLREFTITINEVNDLPEFTMTTNAITVREDSGAYTAEQINDFSTGPANEQDQTISFEVELVEPADAEKFDQQPQIDATGILRFVIARDANTFDGDIPIRITARDSGGDDTDPTTNTSAPQTFTLSITPVNDSPTAGPVQVNGNEDELLTIPFSTLFAQASDPDLIEGDFLTVNLLTPDGGNSKPTGSGGEVRIDLATQTLIYDPTDDQSLLQTLGDGQSQNDTFSFQLIDSVGAASNTGLVTIAVEGRNDAPRVSNDAPTLANNGPTRVDVLANDVDIDGTIVRSTLEITFEPSFGTVEIDPQTREVVYTPVSSSNNDDFFRYTVRDEDGATSLEGEVTLSVNAAPVAVDDEFTTLAGTEVTFDVLANDFDNDGTIDPSSIDVTLPSRGQLARNADNTFTYLPNAQFVGTDSFTYTVVDNGGRISERASVSITVLASTLQNADSNSDVNDDGRVTPIDALLVLNHLRRNGTNSIPVLPTDSPLVSNDPLTFRYYDVSGDQRITPLDALQVINQIRRDRSGGDAEGEWLGGTTNSVSDDVVDSLAIDQIDSDDRDRRNGSNPFDAAFREDWLS